MKLQNNRDEQQTVSVEIELRVEELEEVVAPLIRPPLGNHNETLVSETEEVEMKAEELEEVIAPVYRRL